MNTLATGHENPAPGGVLEGAPGVVPGVPDSMTAGQSLQMSYSEDMKQLPAELMDATTAEKLAYVWVCLHPGEYSARSLSAALGVDIRTALGDLTQKGLLIEEEPRRGPNPGKYRAAPQRPRPRKSE